MNPALLLVSLLVACRPLQVDPGDSAVETAADSDDATPPTDPPTIDAVTPTVVDPLGGSVVTVWSARTSTGPDLAAPFIERAPSRSGGAAPTG